MAQFNIGDKVIKVDNDAHGTVINIKTGRGRVIYTVTFPTGDTNVLESDLRADFDISDPFERCKSGIFGSYSDYAKKNTTFKIRSSNNSTISSLKASKTLFRHYQFKPLLKFINSPNHRLLVADEVGLGKTIEAGHIILELKARRKLNNVLIVCPKSLQEKWKAELYEKFGLTFKIVDRAQDLIADIQAKTGTVRAIVNYEKIRLPKNKAEKKNGRYTNLIDYLEDHPQRFSLILCDEAHKMRNKNQTYNGAEKLMGYADAALFLTATPVMISEENLYNLLHLLDNARYYDYDIFLNRMNENRPFVEAISRLNNNVDMREIRTRLINAEVHTRYTSDKKEIYSNTSTIYEMYKDDPKFIEIDELLQQAQLTEEKKAHLHYLLSTMSVMNTVFSRTRKREVTTDMSQAERRPHLRKIELNGEERERFDDEINNYFDDNSYTDEWGEERLTQGGSLGLVQRKRQIASSVWAYMNEDSDLDRGYDAFSEYEDAKVDELLEIMKKVFANGTKKIVVFAVFRKTLKYLKIRLNKAGYKSVIIHGMVENRAELLDQFKNDENIHVLLSSEVGSEGLDMQFCNSMVNYDLPWNPMVVEQRIGRIDRFGQQSEVVHIFNFVVADSIQEEIYERLLDRIGIFKGTIGDMEAILDADINIDGKTMTIQEAYNKMEKDFYTQKLTKEERERKMSEIKRAMANEKESLQHLQEGLSNTLTNDAYFNDEIHRIVNKKSYVTEEELENYLRAVIRQGLTTCDLDEAKDGIMEFNIPASQSNVLRNFLTQYIDGNDEAQINLNQFKRRIDSKQKFRITFNQEVAYQNQSVNFLNIYHPMIQACLNYFLQHDDENKTSFSYALEADDLLKSGDRYYMGLYQLTSHRMVYGIKKNTSELIPVVFNLQTGEREKNEQIVERIFSRSQIQGSEHNPKNEDIKAATIDDMSFDFTEYISSIKKERYDEEERQIQSDRMHNEKQIVEMYRSRKAVYIRNLKDLEDIYEMTLDEKEKVKISQQMQLPKYWINKLDNDCNEMLDQVNENKQLGIDEKMTSLNLITII